MLKTVVDVDHALIKRLLTQYHHNQWVGVFYPFLLGMRATIGAMLYQSRFCPSPTSPSRLIANLLQPGSVFIDGGAHNGEMSMLASVCVGSQGQVHAFEPQSVVFERLHLAVSLGGFRNIILNRLLLSERSGKLSLFQHPSSAASSVSSIWAPTSDLVKVECSATSLDDYWSSLDNRKAVDLIKLDVEGYELMVIRGCQNLLQSDHPLLIVEVAKSEARQVSFGYTVDEILSYLSALGYRFYVPRGYRFDTVTNSLDLQKGGTDLLCVHEHSRLYERAIQLIQTSAADK